jgi:hypothetical protein
VLHVFFFKKSTQEGAPAFILFRKQKIVRHLISQKTNFKFSPSYAIQKRGKNQKHDHLYLSPVKSK